MDPDSIVQAIESFLDFVAVSSERDEPIMIGDEFQTMLMFDEFSLWELFGEDVALDLPQELRQELAAWLGRVKFYSDSEVWPEGMDSFSLSVDGGPMQDSPDIAWVHHSIRAGVTMSCASIFRSSVSRVRCQLGETVVHFVLDENGRKSFWRYSITFEGDNEQSLIRNAERAYPDLYFYRGVLNHLNNLSGGYLSNRLAIRETLEILNDFGAWVFNFPPPALAPEDTAPAQEGLNPSNQLIEKRFAGFGLDVAPEKPNVRSDVTCRIAREAKLQSRVLYCEWHVKLERHRNRIHLHSPVPESDGKVVVGMIADHLPLP